MKRTVLVIDSHEGSAIPRTLQGYYGDLATVYYATESTKDRITIRTLEEKDNEVKPYPIADMKFDFIFLSAHLILKNIVDPTVLIKNHSRPICFISAISLSEEYLGLVKSGDFGINGFFLKTNFDRETLVGSVLQKIISFQDQEIYTACESIRSFMVVSAATHGASCRGQVGEGAISTVQNAGQGSHIFANISQFEWDKLFKDKEWLSILEGATSLNHFSNGRHSESLRKIHSYFPKETRTIIAPEALP